MNCDVSRAVGIATRPTKELGLVVQGQAAWSDAVSKRWLDAGCTGEAGSLGNLRLCPFKRVKILETS